MFVRNHKAGGSRTRSQVPASPSTRPAPALHLFPPPSCHLRIQSLPTRAGRRLPVLPELRHPSPLTPHPSRCFWLSQSGPALLLSTLSWAYSLTTSQLRESSAAPPSGCRSWRERQAGGQRCPGEGPGHANDGCPGEVQGLPPAGLRLGVAPLQWLPLSDSAWSGTSEGHLL